MWSARQSRKMGRRVAGLLGGLLATILLVAAPAAAAFVDPINVSTFVSTSTLPSYYSASIQSQLPAIAVNKAGRVFVAWMEGSEIFFRRSEPTQGSCTGGLQFKEPPVSLSFGTGTPDRPALAATDNGEVYVAWRATSAIRFRRFTDSSQTFLPPLNQAPLNLSLDHLSQNTGSATSPPSVAADNVGGVFVAWSIESQILFRRLTNYGAGFSEDPLPLSAGLLNGAPSVATDGSSVFVAWAQGSNGFGNPIRLRKFVSSANPTGPESVLVDPLAGLVNPLTGAPLAGLNPHLAFADGFLSVAFANLSSTPTTGLVGAVYHRSLGNVSNGGTIFSDSDFRTFSGAFPRLPSLNPRTARNGSAMLAWAQQPPTETASEIQYWLAGPTQPGLVSPLGGASSMSPAAAMDSTGRLLVAWQGRETADLLHDEIYVSYSGGTGGGSLINALVEMTPQTLNAKTITQGEGVFTLRIRPLDGNAAEIDPGSLKFNDNDRVVSVLRWSLVDTDGIGGPDTLELKIRRSELSSVFSAATLTATQGDTDYRLKVNGNMTGGRCFTAEKKDVRIIHQ